MDLDLTPVHRAIVAVDIKESTRRTDVAKARLRAAMYDTLEAALRASGITIEHHDPLVDRGDGAFALIHPVDHAPKTLLLRTFIPALHELLTAHNTGNPGGELRLRAAVHAGEVHRDQRGWFGEALDLTFRLLDAPALKAALQHAQTPLVLVVSDHIYRTVIRHGYNGINEHAYAPLVDIVIADHRHIGWIHGAEMSITGAA